MPQRSCHNRPLTPHPHPHPLPHPHRVPDLELDLLALDVDHPGAELHADGEVVDRLEPLVGELEKEAGLAHARGGRGGGAPVSPMMMYLNR